MNETSHPSPPSADDRLDALLDAALAVTAPPGLADRIVQATRPHLRAAAPTVLARLGPTLLSLAAVVVLAIGAAAWIATFEASLAPAPAPHPLAYHAGAGLVDTLGEADIDEQITLLALQIDLAERDDWWAPTNEGLDRTTLQYQLDALAGDLTVF